MSLTTAWVAALRQGNIQKTLTTACRTKREFLQLLVMSTLDNLKTTGVKETATHLTVTWANGPQSFQYFRLPFHKRRTSGLDFLPIQRSVLLSRTSRPSVWKPTLSTVAFTCVDSLIRRNASLRRRILYFRQRSEGSLV